MSEHQTSVSSASTEAPRIPTSTYRLQFNRFFTFQDARQVVPYLHNLGITDCYSSPYLKAAPGSLHGYDLVDPTSMNPEIGTEEDYFAFIQALRAYGMGHVLDVVPNHMSIAQSSNPWWLDVLENGPGSRYAGFFDIDWHPLKQELENKVLLPILGDLYGVVLENQDIRLFYEDGRFFIQYHDCRLPIAPKPWTRILTHRLDDFVQRLGADHPHVMELQSIVTALRHLPDRGKQDPLSIEERYREQEVIRRRLSTLVHESPDIVAFLEENVKLFNGRKDDPRSFDLLDGLLNDQAYRLAYWRVASEEINYRRFFDINELAAVRVENPAVFEATHQLIFRFLKEGAITGLRIDHVDGLYDPSEYLQQLQAWARAELPGAHEHDRPLYLIVEKILGKGETLPESWPVYGTTGYDFLNAVNGIFVNSANERQIDDLYTKFTRQRLSFDELVYEKKKLIAGSSMASEINVLGHQLNRFSERDRRSRDFTLGSLIHTIREIIACFPVYRTYVAWDLKDIADRDRAYIRLAVTKAKRRNPAQNALVFDFVQDILLSKPEDRQRPDWEERLGFIMKFQQTTSPVTAKGIEDTALYIYNRLVSLNEVGGDPVRFGIPLSTFHERMRERQATWPYALSATSTHDTKRSEDVRARINVLSEMPGLWRRHLTAWSKLNKKHKSELDGQPVPDRNEEYLLYQTLLGAWPFGPLSDSEYRLFCERIQSYMSKALHEAKIHTSWVNPNLAYEQAVHKFIEAILDRATPNPFLEQFLHFQQKVAELGMYNSLAQVLLKITAPGVPDFYQGTELWDLSLVDPDNRRPVDYPLRQRWLADLQRMCANAGSDRRSVVRELLATRTDGRIKMYITMTALHYRRTHSALFRNGSYAPLEAGGSKQDHVCAFARLDGAQSVVVVVPRLLEGLLLDADGPPIGPEIWHNTWIGLPLDDTEPHPVRYRHLFTGDVLSSDLVEGRPVLRASRVFNDCPVALLEKLAEMA